MLLSVLPTASPTVCPTMLRPVLDCVPDGLAGYVTDRFPDYIPDQVPHLFPTRSMIRYRGEIVDSRSVSSTTWLPAFPSHSRPTVGKREPFPMSSLGKTQILSCLWRSKRIPSCNEWCLGYRVYPCFPCRFWHSWICLGQDRAGKICPKRACTHAAFRKGKAGIIAGMP